MIISDDNYLFSFLNSRLFEWYKKIKFVAYGDAADKGRVKLDYNKMITVPIKKIDNATKVRISALIEKILTFKTEGKLIDKLESEIDKIIYEIYGLTDNEIAIIEKT